MAVTFSLLGDMGRLGNCLFQIASTIGIARSIDVEYSFPIWRYQHGFKKELPNGPIKKEVVWKEQKFEFHRPVINKFYNTDLFGYFQSEKYWIHCKEEVLSYFQFTDELINQQSLKLIAVDTVAIHVRRGDYLNLQDYHPILPLEYYNKAIQYFDKDQKFIVFSDDIEWCKKHFLSDRFSFANGNEIEDLCLMSLCSGHIIANSSFSFWGQYLSGRYKTIAPSKDKWFGKKAKHNVDDLYQDHWILV